MNIGFVCTRSTPGYEAFFVKRKPKYIATQQVSLLDGTVKEIKNTFCFDIKLDDKDYEVFINATDNEVLTLLKEALVESLLNLGFLPKKIKNFDKESFISDVLYFVEDLEFDTKYF